jgi:single-strand DNA-binding protein
MNVFSFTGNVGKDGVLRYTASGSPVLGFSCAATAGFGDKKQTLWIDVSVWGKRGETLEPYIKKGTKLAVSGELSTREHEGKTYLQCRADQVTLLGNKPESEKAGGFREKKAEPEAFADDSIPF